MTTRTSLHATMHTHGATMSAYDVHISDVHLPSAHGVHSLEPAVDTYPKGHLYAVARVDPASTHHIVNTFTLAASMYNTHDDDKYACVIQNDAHMPVVTRAVVGVSFVAPYPAP